MSKYKLSKKADDDIEALYKDGVYKFGKIQALKYLEELDLMLIFLSENPKIGRNRNEIKLKLFSFPFVSHVIFYRIHKAHIRIVRILYGGKDLIKFLK